MAQYELQQQSNFTNNYTTSTGPPVVGSTQKTNLNLAQLNQERHIKNRIFGVRDRNPCEVIMFFFFKIISLGWSELLFVNQITRYEVRKMRIGNRRLNYDTTDGFGIIFRCFWNWLVNYLTFGIWYISGQMSKHYYAHLDERIYWAEEAKPRKPEPEDKIKTAGSFPNLNEYVIWQPENNCRGKIVFYSVHLGWQKELIFVLFKIGAMMTFGLLIPFVYQYYNPKFIARVYFGRGQFVVIPPQVAAQLLEKRTKESPPINYNVQYNSPYPILGETSQTMSEMKMLWTADGGDMFLRFFLGAVISNFTCGLFRCCYWYWWIYNFYNKNSHCYLDLPNQI